MPQKTFMNTFVDTTILIRDELNKVVYQSDPDSPERYRAVQGIEVKKYEEDPDRKFHVKVTASTTIDAKKRLEIRSAALAEVGAVGQLEAVGPIINCVDKALEGLESAAVASKFHSDEWTQADTRLNDALNTLLGYVEMVNDAVRLADEPVTLDQVAAIVGGTSKRSLERYLKYDKLPQPDFPGGKGKAHKWYWSNIRPALEEHCRPNLTVRFPGSRIL